LINKRIYEKQRKAMKAEVQSGVGVCV